MNSRRITERSLSKTDFTDPLGSSISSSEEPGRIVILIPGIRTNADWIDQLTLHLETFSEPIKAYKAYGGRISAIHLVTRFGVNSIRGDIRNQINSIIMGNPGCEISLVCHSMGTDMAADLLIEDIDYKFKYIFFLGSICSRKKAMSIKKSCQCFVNHRGTHDPWPLIASIVRPLRYDYTGVFGFSAAAWVNEFTFNNDHGSCTNVDHVMEFIVPVIMGLKPLGPKNTTSPFGINTHFYIKWFVYILIFVGLIGLTLSVYSLLLVVLGCLVPILFYGIGRKIS